MSQRLRRVMLRSGLMPGLSLALATGGSYSAEAQEKAVEYAPREEMIDAIWHYARSRDCELMRNVFGPDKVSLCELVFARPFEGFMHSASDAALIEACTKNNILDCQKRQEVSTGRPVLTFYAAVGRRGATPTAAWSPDNRFLLVFSRGDKPPWMNHTLVVDVEQQATRTLIADVVGVLAVAWSPDGKYIAANKQRAIHLYASDTLEEKGSIAYGGGNKCSIHSAEKMAFTADSSALWVACGGSGGSYGPNAIAIKLGVPSLQVEDRLFPEPTASDPRSNFRTTAISRHGDDLVLTGQYRTGSFDKPEIVARSFSLGTKEPLHPPVPYVSPERSETYPDMFLTDDLSGILIRLSVIRPDGAELWSTRTGERIAKLHPKTMMDGRSLGAPSRIPSSPLHIEEQWSPSSVRRTLVVLDSRSGGTVQEIGPVTGSLDPRLAGTRYLLVSPDGKMVAHFGRHEIRFYRVNPDAASSAAQGR